MPTPRLQQHFIRLWQQRQGQSSSTTLQELALGLNCSRRHMRSLLNDMQQQGWLTWHAEAGRAKRSHLEFHYTSLMLQQQRAETLLEHDNIDQLVQLVGDKKQVRQMILSQLGRSFHQGRALLRVLYYRPLHNLLPASPLRRSEIHLARQIFSGLTRINEEKGDIEPDISHHWVALTPLHWRFYIRPAVLFHHGRPLEIADILSSLQRLQPLPLFAHIREVSSPSPLVVDLHLKHPDHWLPWLLGSVHSLILPQEWQQLPDFARHPIGTGPYAMVHNSQNQMKIQAFDQYFGFRALIDEVNIWVLEEVAHELARVGVQLQIDETAKNELESRLEEGCYFLLFDQRSPLAADPAIRRWLCAICNPIALLSQADPAYQRYWSPAYGILPRWHHNRSLEPQSKPEGLQQLTLTHYRDHLEHRTICEALRPLLAEHGVTLNIQVVDYSDWYQGNAESDIWLGSANFTMPLEFSLFASLYEMPLVQHCQSQDLNQDLARWHDNQLSLADWAQRMVIQHQLHPLFHHWLQLQGQHQMRGIRMNSLGWFDFKSAWFAPQDI